MCIQPPDICHLEFPMSDRPSKQSKGLRREQEGTSASAMPVFLAERTLQSRDSDRPHILSSACAQKGCLLSDLSKPTDKCA